MNLDNLHLMNEFPQFRPFASDDAVQCVFSSIVLNQCNNDVSLYLALSYLISLILTLCKVYLALSYLISLIMTFQVLNI